LSARVGELAGCLEDVDGGLDGGSVLRDAIAVVRGDDQDLVVLAGERRRDRDDPAVLLEQAEEEAGEAGDAERRERLVRVARVEQAQLFVCGGRCVQRKTSKSKELNAVAAPGGPEGAPSRCT
jgi:hypothetical protein